MERVQRFDRSELGKAIKTDAGFLRVPARLTRTGVFEYLGQDGKIRRELRLPSEVFAPKSIASFCLLPVTDGHPTENGGAVTPKNAKRLQRGNIGTPIREGVFLAADVMITDADLISKVESKTGPREISLGYYCDREPAEPGAKWTDPESGEEISYDFIQRNITGNHVAIVQHGRAGPDARLSMDASTAIQVVSNPKQEPKKMKIKINGITFDVDDTVAQAIEAERLTAEKVIKTHESDTAALRGEVDKHVARADVADATAKKLTTELEAARAPASIAAAVANRLAVETKARALCGAEFKADGLSDLDVKRSVLGKVNPGLTLDGRSGEYVDGAFEALKVAESKPAPKGNPLTERAANTVKNVTADQQPLTVDQKRKNLNASIYDTDATDRKPSRSF